MNVDLAESKPAPCISTSVVFLQGFAAVSGVKFGGYVLQDCELKHYHFLRTQFCAQLAIGELASCSKQLTKVITMANMGCVGCVYIRFHVFRTEITSDVNEQT